MIEPITDVDLNALGQVIDTTWGRSSTPKTASYSVKISFAGGNRLQISYGAIVNFGSENQMVEMRRRYSEESIRIVAEIVKQLKKNYKSLAKKTLTLDEISSSADLELTGMNFYNPKRQAVFRRKTIYEVA